MWERLGRREVLAFHPFPVADPAMLASDTVEVPVQVNGKVRSRITVPVGTTKDELAQLAMADEKVAAHLDGRAPRNTVVVPDRLVNFVV
jgi:leucyl-tRNA synthetase